MERPYYNLKVYIIYIYAGKLSITDILCTYCAIKSN